MTPVAMSTKRCYYEVLEVARDASDRDVAKAYRKLAVRFHPDSNPGDEHAAKKFKECAEAYEVLGDSAKRSRYDRFGHAGVENGHHASAEDIFEAFSGLFGGSMFEGFFGGGQRQRARRGADIRVDVTLTLEEAFAGVKKTVAFPRRRLCEECQGSGSQPNSRPQTCPQCGGRGHLLQSAGILRVQTACGRCRGSGQVITDPCQRCKGSGTLAEQVELEVAIPAGVDDGMRVRLSGEGEPSLEGGPSGDCYCFIAVRNHKLFHRDGQNLILQFPITFSQAALGAEIDVPTLVGRKTLTLPAGSQSGEVYRMRGLGMPNPQGGRSGDLLVQTFIETPKKLSSRQEKILRELAECEQTDVSPQRKSFIEKIKEYFSRESHGNTET